VRTLLQQARLAQWTTVGWMVIEGVVAIGAGIAARSVALTAFGVDSGIELFSSVVVLRRLLQRTESEERGSMTGGERGATKLVGFALYGLIAYIVLSAGVALVFRFEPAASPLGIGPPCGVGGLHSLIGWGVPPFGETQPARWSVCTWRASPSSAYC
jgi:hypothetical protein